MVKSTFMRNILEIAYAKNSRLSVKKAQNPVWTRQIVFELRHTVTSLFSVRYNERCQRKGVKGITKTCQSSQILSENRLPSGEWCRLPSRLSCLFGPSRNSDVELLLLREYYTCSSLEAPPIIVPAAVASRASVRRIWGQFVLDPPDGRSWQWPGSVVKALRDGGDILDKSIVNEPICNSKMYFKIFL